MPNGKSTHLTLEKQVHAFVQALEKANHKRSLPRPQQDYTYIETFFDRVIIDRNKRAEVIDDPKHQKAVRAAKKLIPYPTEMESCMDGRIFGPLIGLYGHIGETLSLAGGILHDFVRDEEDQRLRLRPNSNFAKLLRQHLDQEGLESIVEILDSHIGCAAREAEEMAKGRQPNDHGLLSDVIFKLELCDAMIEFVQETYQGKKSIFPINISLDPHNGCMYMGFATGRAIDMAEKNGGFTDKVIASLVAKGWVISTEALIEEPLFHKEFEKYAANLDMTHHYGESADIVWEAALKMKDQLLPKIIEKLYVVYPHIKKIKVRQQELHERAVLILVNAFTAFLHKNQYSTYPYAEHHEEGVFVAKGNNPPYEVALFAESSLDMKNLPQNIQLAVSIVRNNRKLGRVTDMLGVYKGNNQGFIAAPIGVILQVKVLVDLSQEEWEKFLKINWTELQKINWEKMTDIEFFNFLEETMGTMPLSLVNAINKLRRRTAMLYDVEHPISASIVDHDIVVLPIISDSSKRVRSVIPFLKTGFH